MKVIWFVNFAILFAFMKVFEIPSMIPLYVEELQISYAQAGIFMTAYAFIRCIASLPAGSVTDKWGAVPVISVCLLCIGVFGTLATFGSNYHILLTLRVLVSIGVAIIFIASVDAIPKYMPPENVGKGIGYINGSLNVGVALTLFLTPILSDAIGWRWTARLYSISFLVLFIMSIPLIKSLPKTIDVDRTKNRDRSYSFAELLQNPSIMLLSAGAFIIFIELYGLLTWVPAFLAKVYSYSPAEIGTSATMFGIAAIPASVVTGFLAKSMRRIIWLCVSGGIMAGAGILALIASSHMPLWLTVLTISIITWGHSQVVVCIMSVAAIIVPPHSSGKALGLIFTFAYGGSILPTYLGGYLLEKTGQYDLAFIIFSAAAFMSIAAMVAVGRLLQKNPPPHFKLNTST
ncbi:MAG: putative MFS family arabinose efflux permease [Gammaproteobacteria bacterium]|jgi:predicted MFS family arabinose efflux permease